MKYNIFVMLNDSYFNFGLIFLNSLYKNTNTEYLNKIIINNIGLSEKNKELLLSKFDKIKFFETNKNIIVDKVHSQEWLEALTMKTKILLEVIKDKDNLPLFLMDSDMLILKNFNKFIKSRYDIQICKLKDPGFRNDLSYKNITHIACFMIINDNNQNVINFIQDWIIEIKDMIDKKCIPAYETPAMNKIMNKYNKILNIGDLNNDKIASNREFIKHISHVIHMKSDGNRKGGNHFEYRISKIKNFDKEKILQYLNM